MSEDINKRVEQFIQIRDMLKRMGEEYDKKRAPLLQLQEVLSGKLRAFMEANSLENLKTDAGTCYTSTRYTASLPDPEIFMNFVKTNNKFELLDRKANSTAVREYVKENGSLPPGCNLSALQTVGVRRGKNTAAVT